MRELKDLYTCGCDDGIGAVLQGIAHGPRQLDLPSLDTMPEELHCLVRRAREAWEAASSQPDAERV